MNDKTNESTTIQKKEGLSTGVKVGIGCAAGCFIIFLVLGALAIIAPVILSRFISEDSVPTFLKGWIEKSIEENTGTDVNIDTGAGKWSVTDEGGETTLEYGEDLNLPSDFPSDIPQYNGAQVVSKTSITNGKSVGFTTTDSVSKVTDYYKSQMIKEGWEEITSFETSKSALFTYKKGDLSSSVSIYEGADKTSFTIMYSTETSN